MPLPPMLEATRRIPDHVLEAVDAVEAAQLPQGDVSSVLLVGMGGSSIGGALAAGLLSPRLEVPVVVHRDHEPPGFVGSGTLVVATSYSGDTRETVDAARASLEAGAELVAVTTGGRLAELAAEAGAPVLEPPSGFEPRAAVGWLWAANHATVAGRLGHPAAGPLRSAARSLRDRMDELAAEGGRADELAARLGRAPVGVVGHDVFGVVARRWAGELSENAERLAFHARLPEAGHNQVVGWAGTPGEAALAIVGREDEAPLEAARTRFLAERARKAGVEVVEARVGGPDVAGALEAVALGDLVSLHRARRDGVDPEPVEAIDELKDRLAEAERGAGEGRHGNG